MSSSTSLNNEIRELDSAADEARDADPSAARKKAMDLLARREHSAGELLQKLERAGFVRGVAEAAIAGLTRDGLQSDERYVEAFVQSRVRQGKGPVRIRADLRARGAVASTVDAALAAAATDWETLARSVRERKFGLGRPADFKDKARQMRFLQYRGFEAEHIAAAFDGASNDL